MSEITRRNKAATLAALPPAPTHDLMPKIRELLVESGAKIVILDDDPTGTQTAHDVAVLTSWDLNVLVTELQHPTPAVFVLTNTRSMTASEAETLNREVGENLKAAVEQTGRKLIVISRSDSTLRGHFPLETDTLAEALDIAFDGVLIVPAFMAGGRYTIDGVHYVAEGEELIPVAETPFAQDMAFGFGKSDLRQWVAEKTQGRINARDVMSISLADIRTGGVDVVRNKLEGLVNNSYCVIDAITENDLAVVVMAALQAEAKGKRFLYRTAASFAALYAGQTLRPVLTPAELQTKRTGGGLVVVGSYVPKSSSQLDYLLTKTDIHSVEVQVPALLDENTRTPEIQRVVDHAASLLINGENVVLFTSRDLITGDDADTSLNIGNMVSSSLVTITQQLQRHARFIIAKGGITSSDIATKALAVKRARVAGQILPGVPVWELDDSSAEPNLIYVVFPGNVGDVSAVAEAVAKFG
jgi:uncharacterized protein YgbK (DUF1537 family)